MLIEFKVQNFASFNAAQTLSMLASSSTKENFNTKNTFPVNKFGIKNLLKSAAIFGANASGKTNLIHSLKTLKSIVLESLTTADAHKLNFILPFLIKEDPFKFPTEFEVTFLHDENLYRYGISIFSNTVAEEWLYWTKTTRETMLFHRTGQKIKVNQRSFSEAKAFIRKSDNIYIVEKTRETVPFIAVLSQFNGTKSRKIIEWFKKINIVSGVSALEVKNHTIDLFEKNQQFKSWALKILAALQIQDVKIIEVEKQSPPHGSINSDNEDLKTAMATLQGLMGKGITTEKRLVLIKTKKGGKQSYPIPLALESEGTTKLIYLLGSLFHVINNGEILLIDEFDNKFHSLLSKYIIDHYHISNNSNSQLIIACHDTNLLTNELFRRDQIWFIDKKNNHESQLYSLLEYKEHYTRKGDSYSKDYLSGKYDAIPLFKSMHELDTIIDG